ncbi:hypothetical protein C8A05DRAFT_41715 [Staphylotrichum tortipilum]|uniref:PH domain-containing protein n=1 Tax=Staphylotrichum tortipilum TaxID=2831512 RepID=A0AAN6MQN9_9PEZI|nr:hypothetical protein C8A05DRAFT_41715 [Staphylotrichum longicolle]
MAAIATANGCNACNGNACCNTNASLTQGLATNPGQRGSRAAARRAVVVDGSLQVGDAGNPSTRGAGGGGGGGGGLTTSPSFSPAYLLAALEWAEEQPHGHDHETSTTTTTATTGPTTNTSRAHPHQANSNRTLKTRQAKPGGGPRNHSNQRPTTRPGPIPAPLAVAAGPATPTPRIDLRAEELVFPSRRTPSSFLPTPSSVSLDAAAAARPPIFLSSSPLTSSSPITPGGARSAHRFPHHQHHQFAHREQQSRRNHYRPAHEYHGGQHHHHQYQPQRPRTSNGVGRPRWDDEVDEDDDRHDSSSFFPPSPPSPPSPFPGPHGHAHENGVAQPDDDETRRIFVAAASDRHPADGNHVMYHKYRPMQPPGPPPPSSTPASPPRPQPPPQGSVRETFSFFSRSRKKSIASESSPHSTLSNRSRTLPTNTTNTTSASSTATDVSDYRQSPAVQPVAKMPGPSIEASKLLVKSIGIRCKGSNLSVQVTKETSTADLLRACRQPLAALGRPIDPESCVVIEPCLRPGLERRLREYELVWDVVSAWDHDSSHSLLVLPDSSDPDQELSLASVRVTRDEPAGFVLPLYFMQRPGKWSQRYITLKENGQMCASKKQEFKSADKGVARLCHLSDFDLYMPTESEMRKQLKPPKRYCYAVRSQEKATLFADSAHYVHFFCTEDPNVARQFRSGVHGWRSWYLVNKKLGLHEKQEALSPSSQPRTERSFRGRPSVDQGHRRGPSIDMGSRGRPSVDVTPSYPSSPEVISPNSSGRSAVPPVPPLPASLQEQKTEVFAAGGLLGNGYDERRQQAVRKDAAQRRGTVTSTEGPFIDGPSLLNNHPVTASGSDGRPRTGGSETSHRGRSASNAADQGWFPSALQHSADQHTARPPVTLARRPSTSSHAPSRTTSVRPSSCQPPQPLIDLTPTFIEAPQWSRENRGRGVRAAPGKPLVDLATGPALGPLTSSAAARLRDAAPPPKSLVRRPEVGGQMGPPPQGQTLMQVYERKVAAGVGSRGRGNTVTEGGMGMGMGGGMGGGVVRRNTVRSNGREVGERGRGLVGKMQVKGSREY